MKYLFYCIPPAPNRIKISECQQGTEYSSDNIIIFKKNQLHHRRTTILNYLILIAVAIFYVKSLNYYE